MQRSARTIMVMIQRATENKGQLDSTLGEKRKHTAAHHDRHSFTLTQPFEVPSREEAVERSSSTTPSSSLGSLGESREKL